MSYSNKMTSIRIGDDSYPILDGTATFIDGTKKLTQLQVTQIRTSPDLSMLPLGLGTSTDFKYDGSTQQVLTLGGRNSYKIQVLGTLEQIYKISDAIMNLEKSPF